MAFQCPAKKADTIEKTMMMTAARANPARMMMMMMTVIVMKKSILAEASGWVGETEKVTCMYQVNRTEQNRTEQNPLLLEFRLTNSVSSVCDVIPIASGGVKSYG
jgi:hypothetical protein